MSTEKTSTDKSRVRQRIESTTAIGRPTCDICYNLPRSERSDEAEIWPDQAVHYVRGGESCMHRFLGITVCEHHDHPDYQPEDATHRIADSPRYVGDDHNKINSAYEHRVRDIREVER
jgi:hypothetical protein